MESGGRLLRQVMVDTETTQVELARLSGVRQPSISQALSGRITVSDEQLDRLLSCMGFRLEVLRRPVLPELTRSERRSWQLHRQVARELDDLTLRRWKPAIRKNLTRLRGSVQGEPHEQNLRRWKALIDADDLGGLHRRLTGLDRDAIEMREVSPMSGLLSEQQRRDALAHSR